MSSITLGISLKDKEYEKRFCAILLKHYKGRIEVHQYDHQEDLLSRENTLFQAILLEDDNIEQTIQGQDNQLYIFCLTEKHSISIKEGKPIAGGIVYLDKYQDVRGIIDEIMQQIGNEIKEICGNEKQKEREVGVYALNGTEFQLPFSVTLGEILAEQERVLILDLQENSGLEEYGRPPESECLEDLFSMIKKKRVRKERIESAIGHIENVDYIYSVENTEVLCEVTKEEYTELINILHTEYGYQTIIVNFGSRFQGFFEEVNRCNAVFLLQRRGGSGSWREKEFKGEIARRNLKKLEAQMINIEVPQLSTQADACSRVVEQWRWSAFGDEIRKLAMRSVQIG